MKINQNDSSGDSKRDVGIQKESLLHQLSKDPEFKGGTRQAHFSGTVNSNACFLYDAKYEEQIGMD